MRYDDQCFQGRDNTFVPGSSVLFEQMNSDVTGLMVLTFILLFILQVCSEGDEVST